ncbi:MAG TPA: hypothetical protein VGZ71_11245 [Puia sp.]|nr:hypothetical protein [Puia sp.]
MVGAVVEGVADHQVVSTDLRVVDMEVMGVGAAMATLAEHVDILEAAEDITVATVDIMAEHGDILEAAEDIMAEHGDILEAAEDIMAGRGDILEAAEDITVATVDTMAVAEDIMGPTVDIMAGVIEDFSDMAVGDSVLDLTWIHFYMDILIILILIIPILIHPIIILRKTRI